MYSFWMQNMFLSHTYILICSYSSSCWGGSGNFSHMRAKKGISKLFSFSCCILQTASPCFVAGCAALMSGMHDSLGIPSQRACVSSSSSHAGLPKPLIYVLTAGNYRLLALRLGSTARPPNDSLGITSASSRASRGTTPSPVPWSISSPLWK